MKRLSSRQKKSKKLFQKLAYSVGKFSTSYQLFWGHCDRKTECIKTWFTKLLCKRNCFQAAIEFGASSLKNPWRTRRSATLTKWCDAVVRSKVSFASTMTTTTRTTLRTTTTTATTQMRITIGLMPRPTTSTARWTEDLQFHLLHPLVHFHLHRESHRAEQSSILWEGRRSVTKSLW